MKQKKKLKLKNFKTYKKNNKYIIKFLTNSKFQVNYKS